jgi:hypothetical protein
LRARRSYPLGPAARLSAAQSRTMFNLRHANGERQTAAQLGANIQTLLVLEQLGLVEQQDAPPGTSRLWREKGGWA